jgi:hypothetical protein
VSAAIPTREAQIRNLAGSGQRAEAAIELWKAWTAGELAASQLGELIRDSIWPYLDLPADDPRRLTDEQWVVLFRAAAPITQTGHPVELAFPLRVYRGATGARARGLSWCTSRAMAEPFLERLEKLGETGRIWTTEIGRDAALAVIFRPSDCVTDPQAREIVVDPAGLPLQLEVC